jgi:hypothetical protein
MLSDFRASSDSSCVENTPDEREILDLNLISYVVHNTDSFLPGLQSVGDECMLSELDSWYQPQMVFSRGTQQSPSIRLAQA